MKERIAFPQLVELVAEKAKTTTRMSELFLQELFAVVSHALVDGETVKIKGLGSFQVKNVDGEKEVFFTPDNDLAETVNAPFAQFKPLELSDEITNEQLAEIDAEMEQRQPESKLEEPASAVEETVPVVEGESKSYNKLAQEAEPVESVEESSPQLSEEPDSQPQKNGLARWWWAGVAAIAAIGLLAWVINSGKSRESNQQHGVIAKVDTVATETKPVVNDTIDTLAKNNVLTLMARKLRHAGEEALKLYLKVKEREGKATGKTNVKTNANGEVNVKEKDFSKGKDTKVSPKSNSKNSYRTMRSQKKNAKKSYSRYSRAKKSYKRHYRR